MQLKIGKFEHLFTRTAITWKNIEMVFLVQTKKAAIWGVNNPNFKSYLFTPGKELYSCNLSRGIFALSGREGAYNEKKNSYYSYNNGIHNRSCCFFYMLMS